MSAALAALHGSDKPFKWRYTVQDFALAAIFFFWAYKIRNVGDAYWAYRYPAVIPYMLGSVAIVFQAIRFRQWSAFHRRRSLRAAGSVGFYCGFFVALLGQAVFNLPVRAIVSGPLFLLAGEILIWLIKRIVRRDRIAGPPGLRIAACCRFLLPKRLCDRVAEPVIADMQAEIYEALARGQKIRARWIWLREHISLLRQVGFYSVAQSIYDIIKLVK